MVTSTSRVSVPVPPASSVTVRVTRKVPGTAQVWVTVDAPVVAAEPSSKSKLYSTTVPSGSLEAVPSAV